MERRGARVPVPERVAARDGLLRQRQRLRPVSGAGVRGDRLRGSDELRARLADVHRHLPAHDAHGFRTAHLLHLQPRRAGPRLHQAPVHRPRVSRRRGPGGLRVHPGEGLRQPGAHAARPRLSQAAGGAAAGAAARAPRGRLERVRGAGIRRVARRPRTLRRREVDARDRAVRHSGHVAGVPQLRLRLRQALLRGLVGGGLRRAAVPHPRALRLRARRTGHRRALDAGADLRADPHHGGHAPLSARPGHPRRGRPRDLGRVARRQHRRHCRPVRRVLRARRPQAPARLDAGALPAGVRRSRAADAVRIPQLPGHTAHAAAAALRRARA